jgi:hypothetical protein
MDDRPLGRWAHICSTPRSAVQTDEYLRSLLTNEITGWPVSPKQVVGFAEMPWSDSAEMGGRFHPEYENGSEPARNPGGLTCGANPGSPITPDYQPPFKFTGTLLTGTIGLSGDLITDTEAEIRIVMARQ